MRKKPLGTKKHWPLRSELHRCTHLWHIGEWLSVLTACFVMPMHEANGKEAKAYPPIMYQSLEVGWCESPVGSAIMKGCFHIVLKYIEQHNCGTCRDAPQVATHIWEIGAPLCLMHLSALTGPGVPSCSAVGSRSLWLNSVNPNVGRKDTPFCTYGAGGFCNILQFESLGISRW